MRRALLSLPFVLATAAFADKAPTAPLPMPPDGKYEKVSVEGRTVPMIQIMNGGTIVLVDTDGKKPRTWEEQFKNTGLPKGYFDAHKTNTKHGPNFESEPIDRTGRWKIDVKGNVEKD